MHADQFSLFSQSPPVFPDGFRYQETFLSLAEEAALMVQIAELPFREFEFHGYKGKRRTVSFGWHYDFNHGRLEKADDIPDFLRQLGTKTAALGFDPGTLQHVLVTEYAPGAGIGWHKDRPVFGDVIGISLGSPCLFRLRRRVGEKFERRSHLMPPRSAYLLAGHVRWDWEHSIPPVEALRYSITFRNFLKKDASL